MAKIYVHCTVYNLYMIQADMKNNILCLEKILPTL